MYIKMSENIIHVALFFPSLSFVPLGFLSKVFNEATDVYSAKLINILIYTQFQPQAHNLVK
jgi:hypothetical protein